MSRCLELASHLSRMSSNKAKKFKVDYTFRQTTNELSQAVIDRSKISLCCDNERNAAFACMQANLMSKASCHWELQDKQNPVFSDRCLFVAGTQKIELGSGLSLAMPDGLSLSTLKDPLSSDEAALMCERIVSLGFNIIVLGSARMPLVNHIDESVDVAAWIKLFHEYQLKVFFQFDDLESLDVLTKVCADLPDLDGIFFFSQVSHSENNACVVLDSYIAELENLELCVPDQLQMTYCLTESSSHLTEEEFLAFLPYLSSRSSLSFFSTEGRMEQVYRSPNKNWNALKNLKYPSGTALLPMMNVGALGLGDGLWPWFAKSYIQSHFGKMKRHAFKGCIAVTRYLPEESTLAWGNLWTCTQYLWHGLEATESFENWLRAYYPSYQVNDLMTVLSSLSGVVEKVQKLRNVAEEQYEKFPLRVEVEALLAQLTYIEELNNLIKTPFSQQISFFFRDARRVIFSLVKFLGYSLPNLLSGDHLKESFWTELDQGPGKGLSPGTQVNLRNRPNIGLEGSEQHSFYSSICMLSK